MEYNDTEYNGLLLFLVECMINYVQDCYKMCCHDGSGIFYHLKQKIISMVFISEQREEISFSSWRHSAAVTSILCSSKSAKSKAKSFFEVTTFSGRKKAMIIIVSMDERNKNLQTHGSWSEKSLGRLCAKLHMGLIKLSAN